MTSSERCVSEGFDGNSPELFYHAIGLKFWESVEHCRSQHEGQLAVIGEDVTMERLVRLSPKGPECFANYFRVGLVRGVGEDQYQWVDGTSFSGGAMGVKGDFPNDTCSGVALYTANGSVADSLLHAVDCSTPLAFVCAVNRVQVDEHTHKERIPVLVGLLATFVLMALISFVIILVCVKRQFKSTRSDSVVIEYRENETSKEGSGIYHSLVDVEVANNDAENSTGGVKNEQTPDGGAIYSFAKDPDAVSEIKEDPSVHYSTVNKTKKKLNKNLE